MRTTRTLFVSFMVLLGAPVFAELQNVEVGGSIRIRYNYFSPEATGLSFSDKGNSLEFFEQRTRLNVRASFTNDVSAFIELDSYDIYGEDFRAAGYPTGADTRAASVDDVEVYQAYITVSEAWGIPLTINLGRQEIVLGSEWLVGNNDTSSAFTGLSFDGVTMVYTHEKFTVAWGFLKLAETSPTEEDGDADLMGVYSTYLGIDDMVIDAYWLFADDGLSPANVNPRFRRSVVTRAIEGLFGVDLAQDTTKLHTVGLRAAGTKSNFDFETEAAYQFGTISLLGDDVDFDGWAANLELGYTFETKKSLRIFGGAAFFSGGDEKRVFGGRIRTLGFNRLFSDWEYSEFIDATDLGNSLILRGGLSLKPTESVELRLQGSYFKADEDTNRFFRDSDDELGWEVDTYLTYRYSEDLTFEFGYAHFFAGEGIEDGNFVQGNGLALLGGGRRPRRSNDDADYVYFESSLAF